MTPADARHILHVDMDAFFAAVEQLDRPELRGQPVLVGGRPESRGVVATASYEARPFGCGSAMPMAAAIRRCPHAVVVAPRMARYAEVSRQLFSVLGEFTPLVEPLSIDEAFLDLTGCTRLLGAPRKIAVDLKQRIRSETQLTASVGVAPNKFVAKLASDLQKPDGLTVVDPAAVQAFLDPLPISRLWGAGPATVKRFAALGASTFSDVRQLALPQLRATFGESGDHFYRLVRGIDDRPVVPDHQAKSISHEVTFATDVANRDHLRSVALDQMDSVARRLRRQGLLARTVVLKVRTPDFATATRRKTLAQSTDQTDLLWRAASELFDAWTLSSRSPVRLIGMGVTQLSTAEGGQLPLFEPESQARGRRLDGAVDQIREQFGPDAITRGTSTR